MKSTILILAVVLGSGCTHITHDVFEGRWEYAEGDRGCSIELEGGSYKLTKWDDDIVNSSAGRYFVNKNDARQTTTLTFVPDLLKVGNRTVFLPCENFDVLTISDTAFTVQTLSQPSGVGGRMSSGAYAIQIYSKR